MTEPLASGAANPLLVNPGPRGETAGPELIGEWVDPFDASPFFRFHARNQLGSLMGVTDINGYRLEEYEYGENGEVFRRPLLFDGRMDLISSVAHDSPSANQSTITMTGSIFAADEFNGAQIVVSVPSDGNDRYRVGVVLDTTASTLIISDAGTYDIAAAIYNGAAVIGDFVLFDFNDATVTNAPSGYQLGGAWSGVSHSAGTTTLTDSGGNFQPWLVGSMVCPNVEFPSYFEITGTTSTTLTVTGDLTSIAASGNFYRVHIPPGADKTYGTLATINTLGEDVDWDVAGAGSKYLWAQYRYMAPMLGYLYDPDGEGILPAAPTGYQSGTNKRGQYYCLNRNYDIRTGRWISPDQASTPWWNLFDYCWQSPLQLTDSSGLMTEEQAQEINDRARRYIAHGMPPEWAYQVAMQQVEEEYRAREASPFGAVKGVTGKYGASRGTSGYQGSRTTTEGAAAKGSDNAKGRTASGCDCPVKLCQRAAFGVERWRHCYIELNCATIYETDEAESVPRWLMVLAPWTPKAQCMKRMPYREPRQLDCACINSNDPNLVLRLYGMLEGYFRTKHLFQYSVLDDNCCHWAINILLMAGVDPRIQDFTGLKDNYGCNPTFGKCGWGGSPRSKEPDDSGYGG